MWQLIVLCQTLTSVSAYFGSYTCRPDRDVVVHLFEWKWSDIQKECTWLAQNNFCAVQVSPPNEHVVLTNPAYPWYQRYQPVSYLMSSRSGNAAQFQAMVTACNNLGVYIYVDGVINHMTGGGSGIGSAGSSWNGDTQSYPGVPYGKDVNGAAECSSSNLDRNGDPQSCPGFRPTGYSNYDFHGAAECPTSNLEIQNYQDVNQVRNCRLVGLRDLKGGTTYVRDEIAAYLNQLIGWGVAGFRLDACKHMWPDDISAIVSRLNNLNTQWFQANTKPYIYQEVIDNGGEPIKATDYVGIGRVTEFKHCKFMGEVVRKINGQKLAFLHNYGQAWGMLNPLDALVFVDDHDNQRNGDINTILTFFDANMYKIATAFELAFQYGHVRIMSSYHWQRKIVGGQDKNNSVGPPSDGNGNTKDVDCSSGEWICEHRWRQIFNMVRFHNVALGKGVSNWWDNGNNAIAFGRNGTGFIFINNEGYDQSITLSTGMPAGTYCDVITCDNNKPPCGNLGGKCRPTITVQEDGTAVFNVPTGEDPMIAIHV